MRLLHRQACFEYDVSPQLPFCPHNLPPDDDTFNATEYERLRAQEEEEELHQAQAADDNGGGHVVVTSGDGTTRQFENRSGVVVSGKWLRAPSSPLDVSSATGAESAGKQVRDRFCFVCLLLNVHLINRSLAKTGSGQTARKVNWPLTKEWRYIKRVSLYV
jgi:hypothetical protein